MSLINNKIEKSIFNIKNLEINQMKAAKSETLKWHKPFYYMFL
jgi:hypothetical protein